MTRIAHDQTADTKASSPKAPFGQPVPKETSERFQSALSDALVKGSQKLRAAARAEPPEAAGRLQQSERPFALPPQGDGQRARSPHALSRERQSTFADWRAAPIDRRSPVRPASADPAARDTGAMLFRTNGPDSVSQHRYDHLSADEDRWSGRSSASRWLSADAGERERESLSFNTSPRGAGRMSDAENPGHRSPRLGFVSAIAAAELQDSFSPADGDRTQSPRWSVPDHDAQPSARHVNPIRAALQQAGVSTLYDDGPSTPAESMPLTHVDLPERVNLDAELSQMAQAATQALSAEAAPSESAEWSVSLREHASTGPTALNSSPEENARRTRRGGRAPEVRIVQNARSQGGGSAPATTTLNSETSAPSVTVNIVRQEVHLPPVRTHSLGNEALEKPVLSSKPSAPSAEPILAQLRSALLADPAADPATQQSDPAGGRQAPSAGTAQAQVVKVVELMLRPASLGLLTVTMRLTGSGLRVSINASERETTALLQEQEEALKAVLGEAGYEIEGIDLTFKSRPESAVTRPATLYGGRA